jgi:hypothetical protein
MSFFELILALTCICTTGGVLCNYIGYRQKLAELRLKGGQEGQEQVVAELRELKKQMADLRDTTTRYDMSFDAALQRIESRTSNVEQRMSQMEDGARTAQGQGR